MQVSSQSVWYKTMRFFNSEQFWRYENGYLEFNSCAYFWMSIWTTIQSLFLIAMAGTALEIIVSYWVWFLFDYTIATQAMNELSRYINLGIVLALSWMYFYGMYKDWLIERKSRPDYTPPVKKESVFWNSLKARKDKFCFKIDIVD